MAYEKKPGDLSVFKNDRKEKDTHPDYRIVGLDLNGRKIKGALWLKTDRNGNKFMSGKIEDDEQQARAEVDAFRSGDQGSVSRDASDDPFADSIPF